MSTELSHDWRTSHPRLPRRCKGYGQRLAAPERTPAVYVRAHNCPEFSFCCTKNRQGGTKTLPRGETGNRRLAFFSHLQNSMPDAAREGGKAKSTACQNLNRCWTVTFMRPAPVRSARDRKETNDNL